MTLVMTLYELSPYSTRKRVRIGYPTEETGNKQHEIETPNGNPNVMVANASIFQQLVLGLALGWLGLALGWLGLALGWLGLALGWLERALGWLGLALGWLGLTLGWLERALGPQGYLDSNMLVSVHNAKSLHWGHIQCDAQTRMGLCSGRI